MGSPHLLLGVSSVVLSTFANVYSAQIISCLCAGYSCEMIIRLGLVLSVVGSLVVSLVLLIQPVGKDSIACHDYYIDSNSDASLTIHSLLLTIGSSLFSPSKPTPVVVPHPRESFLPQASATMFRGLGLAQVGLGVAAILANIAANVYSADVMSYVGAGYWCGIMCIVSGGFGVAIAAQRTKGFIITFMVLSIVAATLNVALITTAGIGLSVTYDNTNCEEQGNCDISVGLNVALAMLGLAETVVGIVSSAICCAFVCGKQDPKED